MSVKYLYACVYRELECVCVSSWEMCACVCTAGKCVCGVCVRVWLGNVYVCRRYVYVCVERECMCVHGGEMCVCRM